MLSLTSLGRPSGLALAALAVLSLAARPARAADYSFTLDNGGAYSVFRPTVGTTLVGLLGTITNLTNTSETVGTSFVASPFDAASDSLLLAAGQPSATGTVIAALGSVHKDIFDFSVTPTTPLGLYQYQFDLKTKADTSITINGQIIDRTFSINVLAPNSGPGGGVPGGGVPGGNGSAVPESSSFALLALGLLPAGLLARKRRRSA